MMEGLILDIAILKDIQERNIARMNAASDPAIVQPLAITEEHINAAVTCMEAASRACQRTAVVRQLEESLELVNSKPERLKVVRP